MRRRAIDIKKVLMPFALIIATSVVVLICWQVLDPLEWERYLLSSNPEVNWNSYGQCQSANLGVLPYVIPLAFLFAIIILMTLAISWKMKSIQSELSEAKWIFMAIFSHLQVWAVGIPIFLILETTSKDASYLISMCLIFIFSNTFVCLVIWPKIYMQIKNKYFGGSSKKSPMKVNINGGTTYISGLSNPMETPGFGSGENLPISSANHFSSAAKYDNERLNVLSLEAEIEDLKAKLAAIGTGGRDLEVKPPDDVKKPIEDCESQEQPLDDSTLKSSVSCHM